MTSANFSIKNGPGRYKRSAWRNYLMGAGTLVRVIPGNFQVKLSRGKFISPAEALYGDWCKVGHDLSDAVGHVEAKLNRAPANHVEEVTTR